MKRIVKLFLSPLLIGALLGAAIPLIRYNRLNSNAEISRGLKRAVLARLDTDVILGCMLGLIGGIVCDTGIRRLRRAISDKTERP